MELEASTRKSIVGNSARLTHLVAKKPIVLNTRRKSFGSRSLQVGQVGHYDMQIGHYGGRRRDDGRCSDVGNGPRHIYGDVISRISDVAQQRPVRQKFEVYEQPGQTN